MILSEAQIQSLSGLEPKAWAAVGPGFAREEIKSLVLRAGGGLTSFAVTSAIEIAQRIAGAEAVLEPVSRQEALRMLVAEPRILAKLPELKRLRRQRGFYRRLDRAIQAGRLAAAHDQEMQVQLERLESRFGRNPLRDELLLLAGAYEAWLDAAAFWDPPRVFRAANERLSGGELPVGMEFPETVYRLGVQEPESLELAFWDQVSRFTRVEPVWQAPPAAAVAGESLRIERWHTIDDACEKLAEELASLPLDEVAREHVVLIPDSAPIRRSLKRALSAWGVPEADPRDPNRLRFEEALKWALLPLDAVAGNFKRDTVLAWASAHFAKPELLPQLREATANRGARQGLRDYAGGALQPLHSALEDLLRAYGGKKTCRELAETHLGWLESALSRLPADKRSGFDWLVPFLKGAWESFDEDLARLGFSDRRAGLLYWVERLSERIDQAPSPSEKMRPKGGIRVYRLHQAPLEPVARVWILGMPSHWLSAGVGESVDDYWLSERSRETLSAEFAVRSGIQIRNERVGTLRAWIGTAREARILDALHDPDGREREGVRPVLAELFEGGAVPETEEKGAHGRWAASYGADRPVQPREVRLPALLPGTEGVPEITATALDRASRCSFQALALDRWKLWDVREPDTELWAHVRGNLLHEAVKILLQTRDGEGRFTLTSAEALDRAWKAKPPQGLVRSRRLETHLKSRLIRVLNVFREKEREYFERARPLDLRTVSLDDREFRFRSDDDFLIRGKPDRIDETDRGLFIMDYKTSSAVPSGRVILEKGYRLQLPFYAIAAGRELGKAVLGVQFIQLNNAGSRGSGMFFKATNGKEEGKLTSVTARSHSLLEGEPAEAWSALEERIVREAGAYVRGEYAALPKDPKKECPGCSARDLCGYGRRVVDGLEQSESGDGAGGEG